MTRGSSRQSPNTGAIGPRAQATTAGTSSATMICASSPGSAQSSAQRKTHAQPADQYFWRGPARELRSPRQFRQRLFRAASSRLFISSLVPSMMENSLPRCFSAQARRRRPVSVAADRAGPGDQARTAGWLQRGGDQPIGDQREDGDHQLHRKVADRPRHPAPASAGSTPSRGAHLQREGIARADEGESRRRRRRRRTPPCRTPSPPASRTSRAPPALPPQPVEHGHVEKLRDEEGGARGDGDAHQPAGGASSNSIKAEAIEQRRHDDRADAPPP